MPSLGRRRGPVASLLVLAVLLTGAAASVADASTPRPSAVPAAPEVAIAGADEPGTPLCIAARVVDDRTGDPVAGAAVVVYQADDGGEYEPADAGDESTARLRAQLTTDDEGRFVLRTILPGEYPDQPPGNRHIHVASITADGYEPRGFVILFEGNVREEVRAWATSTGFGEIIELTGTGGRLDGWLEVALEPADPGRLDVIGRETTPIP